MKISDLKGYTVLGNSAQPGQAPAQAPDNRDFLQKAGDFAGEYLPGGKIGQAVGTALVGGKEILTGHPGVAHNILQTAPSAGQVAGSGANAALMFAGGGFGQAAEGAGLGAKALNLAKNVGVGAGIGYGNDVATNLENKSSSPLTPGVGTAVGAALPVAGAVISPAKAIIGRLLKGLGSAASGVSGETIDKIVSNPEFAQQASNKIANSSGRKVLEDNARTLTGGIGKIQKEASATYGKGLDSLASTDINPEHLKSGFFDTLAKHGVQIGENGKPDFTNAEFLDPKMHARAENVINTINQQKDLSGKGVRKLMDVVDSAKFKSAPDGDRQAFNSFIGDLHNSLREGVGKSTNKLDAINAKYSQDKQLMEAAQGIFGKVKFNNLKDVVDASKSLESLFSQKGLEPKVMDDFLNRIGVNPEEFKTTEAVRQIENVQQPGNSPGFSFGEVMRSATSAVITPNAVKNLAILAGMSQKAAQTFLHGLKPAARNILIQALERSQQTGQPQEGL